MFPEGSAQWARMTPALEGYFGIDYSGAQTPSSGFLQVHDESFFGRSK